MNSKEEQRAPLLTDEEMSNMVEFDEDQLGMHRVRKWYEAKRASGELIHIPPGSKVVPKGTILHADGRVEIPWLGLGELRVVKTATLCALPEGGHQCSSCERKYSGSQNESDWIEAGQFCTCGAKIVEA